jgi:hypothetical protein
MLLLFALEHVMLLLVVLVLVLVPDEPAGSTGSSTHQARHFPASSPSLTLQQQQQHTAGADGPHSNVRVKLAAVESQPRLVSGGGQGAGEAEPQAIPVPVSVHGNPLFTVSTARKSEGA